MAAFGIRGVGASGSAVKRELISEIYLGGDGLCGWNWLKILSERG